MQDFQGTVYLLDDPDTVLDAKVKVDLNNVTVSADGAEIGAWRHADVAVKKIKDQIHMTADGETLVMELDGRDFFLDLLGIDREEPKKRGRRKKKTRASEPSMRFSLADIKAQARENAADQIDRRLAIAMAVASVVILAGAALTWGPFRLMDPGSFPVARLLAGFGGLAGLLAVYLAYFDRSRFTGSAAAVAAGVVTFCVVYLYARSARLGIGFILALLGAQALLAVGVIGIRRPVGPDVEDEEA